MGLALDAQGEIKADFLDCSGRQLFYLQFDPPSDNVKASVLFLPPFTEEMNMSRRVVAGQARALARAGYRVMLLDVTGTGDAGGDFLDAGWTVWREDAQYAVDALTRIDDSPVILWGLRLGALLATDVAQSRSDIEQLVLWQPVLNGEQQVDQFLRLRTASAILNNAVAFDRKSLWNDLREGRPLHIAGYGLSPTLALELAQVRLNNFTPSCPVSWLELGRSADPNISLASTRVVEQWIERSVTVRSRYVAGEPFWRNIDAGVSPLLYDATLTLVAGVTDD